MPDGPFTGQDFSKEALTPDENARLRELLRELGRAWPTLAPIAQVAGSAKTIASILAGAGAIGVGIGWAVQQGWFQ